MGMKGKIIAALPMRSGRSAKGDWKSQQYVFETDDKYPMHLLFDVFGKSKMNEFNIREGETLTVCFDPTHTRKTAAGSPLTAPG